MMFYFVILVVALLGATADSQNYQIMKYVLQWQPGVCRTLRPWEQCKPDINQLFTIHGLWPSYSNGYTVGCTAASPTDQTVANLMNQNPDLENDLDEIWPDLLAGNTNRGFWAHEWGSHGHCTRFVLNAYQYFKAATTINQNLIIEEKKGIWNLYNLLYSGNIYPGNSYKKNQFRAALATLVHNTDSVEVMCRSNGTHNILYEIRLSVDPQFQHFVAPTKPAVYTPRDSCVFPGL